MKADAGAGHDEFLALLKEQPGGWNRAKAAAFEELIAAFPSPAGPPEWALRQILRGQFDRRIPAAWRPVFIEVFHQWLGFRAESEAATESLPTSMTWWTRPLLPGLRAHGWAGSLASPLAALLLLTAFAWACLATAHVVRSSATRRSDAALISLGAIRARLDGGEAYVMRALEDGSYEKLLEALAIGAEMRLVRDMVVAERERTLQEIAEAERVAATWWAWPGVSAR